MKSCSFWADNFSGLDMLNGAHHWLDLVPKGRNESRPHKMEWVRLHDE
jgi:predicted dithiol-disulfide oxidoreductase (DUF899 family)